MDGDAEVGGVSCWSGPTESLDRVSKERLSYIIVINEQIHRWELHTDLLAERCRCMLFIRRRETQPMR
jgi:hypothetical protein